jgi:hypothetical protein
MALHCAARLGLLDYLYSKRSTIAFSLGLTAERVIASCGLGHYQQESLAMADEGDHPGNPIGSQALEINVFFQVSLVLLPILFPITISTQTPASPEGVLSGFGRSQFHPPSLKA